MALTSRTRPRTAYIGRESERGSEEAANDLSRLRIRLPVDRRMPGPCV